MDSKNVAVFWKKIDLTFEKNQCCMHFSTYFIDRGADERAGIKNSVADGRFATRKLSIEALTESLKLVFWRKI